MSNSAIPRPQPSQLSQFPLNDYHCHLASPEFTGYEGTALARAKRAQLQSISLMSIDLLSFQDNVELVRHWQKVYPEIRLDLALGFDMELLVPHSDIFSLEHFQMSPEKLVNRIAQEYLKAEALAERENLVIAQIGEIGLDHYWLNQFYRDGEISQADLTRSESLQEALLTWQLDYAREHKLPVSLHSRGAEVESLALVRQHYSAEVGRLVFHSFTGSADLMREIINSGYGIGINGIITYKSAETLREAILRQIHQGLEVGKTTLEAMGFYLETDAPFLIPSNGDRDGLKRDYKFALNEPASVKLVAEYLLKQLQANYYT